MGRGGGASRARRVNLERRSPRLTRRQFVGAAVETERVKTELARLARRLRTVAAKIDPADPLSGSHDLDERTAADLLDELNLHPTARWLAEHRLRERFAVDPDHVSLLYLCQQ